MIDKRYVSLALAAFMLFAPGCAGGSASAESAAEPTEITAAASEDTAAGAAGTAPAEEASVYPSAAESVNLTLAVSSGDMLGNTYTDIVTGFQEKYEAIQIEFVDYGSDLTQLKLELAAGDGPDLLLPGTDVGLLTGMGALTDLYSYLDSDAEIGRDDFTNLDLLEIDGQLTTVAPAYTIDSYMGLQDTYPAGYHWTLEEFLTAVTEADSPQEITGNITGSYFISSVLKGYLQKHVSYTDCTCDFETGEFEAILSAAAAINLNADDPEVYDGSFATYAELFSHYPQVIYPCSFSGVSGYSLLLDQLYGTPVTFVGLPIESGNGALARFGETISMCIYTEQPDACWEFIKFCLTDDSVQNSTGQFPVLTSALEEQINSAITEDTSTAAINIQEALALEISGSYTAAITAEEADALREILNGGLTLCQYDSTITPIVTEEAEACLSGEKTPEETAKLIQNRVQIYLSEQS